MNAKALERHNARAIERLFKTRKKGVRRPIKHGPVFLRDTVKQMRPTLERAAREAEKIKAALRKKALQQPRDPGQILRSDQVVLVTGLVVVPNDEHDAFAGMPKSFSRRKL